MPPTSPGLSPARLKSPRGFGLVGHSVEGLNAPTVESARRAASFEDLR